jgi:hypothetical protein
MLNHLKPINSFFVLGHKIDKKYSENTSAKENTVKSPLTKLKSEN